MTDYGAIQVEREGRVGIIRWNRPDSLNAFNAQLGQEFYEAMEAFNADDGIGAVVTTGNGRGYSSGADLSARVSGNWDETRGRRERSTVNPWRPEYLAVQCKPLVAAVNGIALGIGITSILWYDAIVASTQARFSMRFAAIGLTPEVTSAWALPRLIGYQNAKEMMLTGRIYSAQEALEMGLARRLVEPDQLMPEAIKLAAEIAANPIGTVQTVKRMTFHDFFAPDLRAAEAQSDREFAAAIQSLEHREAVRAFAEKRAPRFHEREYMQQLAAATQR